MLSSIHPFIYSSSSHHALASIIIHLSSALGVFVAMVREETSRSWSAIVALVIEHLVGRLVETISEGDDVLLDIDAGSRRGLVDILAHVL